MIYLLEKSSIQKFLGVVFHIHSYLALHHCIHCFVVWIWVLCWVYQMWCQDSCRGNLTLSIYIIIVNIEFFCFCSVLPSSIQLHMDLDHIFCIMIIRQHPQSWDKIQETRFEIWKFEIKINQFNLHLHVFINSCLLLYISKICKGSFTHFMGGGVLSNLYFYSFNNHIFDIKHQIASDEKKF